MGGLNTRRDERRWVIKFDPVFNLFDELADYAGRVHIALSPLCNEVPELLDCGRVDVKLSHQGGNPVLDVRYLLRAA